MGQASGRVERCEQVKGNMHIDPISSSAIDVRPNSPVSYYRPSTCGKFFFYAGTVHSAYMVLFPRGMWRAVVSVN